MLLPLLEDEELEENVKHNPTIIPSISAEEMDYSPAPSYSISPSPPPSRPDEDTRYQEIEQEEEIITSHFSQTGLPISKSDVETIYIDNEKDNLEIVPSYSPSPTTSEEVT